MDVLGPVLSAIGSTFNSVLNYLGVKSTNASNEAINQRALEQQRDLQMQSESWLHSENQIARDWNSPVNQKALYREAGINPFLSESAQIGSAGTAPSAAPTPSAPAQIAMQAPRFDFDSAIRNVLSSKAVDASSAANRAEAFSRFVQAIPTISRYLDNDAVKSLLDEYLPQFVGSEYKGSQEYQLTQLAIEQNGFERDLSKVEASIAKKYGDDKAQQELWNLQQHAAKVATEMGLWNSLSRMNDSNVALNEAKIREVASTIYRNVSEANYKNKLGLTVDEMRTFTVANLALDYLNNHMDYQSHAADFEEMSGVREYKQTKAGKAGAATGYISENAIPTKMFDFVVGRAAKAVGLQNQLPTFGAPWRDNGIRYREVRPNQYGGRTSKEWIFYPSD